jgi:diguanylate cyclase (GGDEF)-like protein
MMTEGTLRAIHGAAVAGAIGTLATLAITVEAARPCALLAIVLALAAQSIHVWTTIAVHRRIRRLTAAARGIADGSATALVFSDSPGSLAELERTIVRVADSMAGRELTISAEAARQQLDAKVQRALAMAETESDVLDVAARALAQVIPSSPAEILLADEPRNELHLAAVAPAGAPGCPVESPGGCAALRGSQTLRFAAHDALDVCPRLRGRPGGQKPAACVPLSVMGRTVGVLHATTTPERPFDDGQVASLELVASHVGRRLRMLQMLETFQSEASTDPLTGLANRRSFEERGSAALRGSAPIAIIIADIDHFKRLNDTYGHAAGDHGLRLFGRTLTTSLNDARAICARIGGEEFALLVPRTSAEDAVKLVDRVREDLRLAHERDGGPAFTSSFGVAMYPRDGYTLKELLGGADRALYGAKAAGRDCTIVLGMPPPAANRADQAPRRRSSVAPLSLIPGPSTSGRAA